MLGTCLAASSRRSEPKQALTGDKRARGRAAAHQRRCGELPEATRAKRAELRRGERPARDCRQSLAAAAKAYL